MNQLDIIVPVRNEKGNIEGLVRRIDSSLSKEGLSYSIIFIDDFSDDGTKKEIQRLTDTYPIAYYEKQGKIGKAFSILEGSRYSEAPLIAMIDGDLQYPPEALPEMYKIAKSKGVCVANRKKNSSSFLRKIGTEANKLIFERFLLGFSCDTQSGLKVFRRDIIKNLSEKDVTGWTLDMPLLAVARKMGFEIGTYEIAFEERKVGVSKVNFVKTAIEIALASIKLRFNQKEVFVFEGNSPVGAGYLYKGKRFITHNNLSPEKSAITTLTAWQKVFAAFLFSLLVNALTMNFLVSLIVLLGALTFLYFIDALFSAIILYKSLKAPPEIEITERELENLDDRTLPTYTIFCPLYKESKILPHFLKAIEALDWPKNRLDVMLLLEEDDDETRQAAQNLNLPEFVRVVVVPHSLPKTKPKACNYGLAFAKGEYAVIYDAEDRPDPKQLKKSYLGFQKAGSRVFCIQSKLNYYNPDQNLLTKFFTAEYSLWFDLILPGLQSIESTIPLGGTSNHFRTNDLRSVQGWDPFNVTEDCDLGARLFRQGYRTEIINSTTYEEANSKLKNWLRQRSRWIKGYMQTYFVHMRDPLRFLRQHGVQALIFQLIIGMRMVFIMINPLLWLATISYYTVNSLVGPTIESLFPAYVYYPAVFSLVFGNFMYVYAYMIGLSKRGHWHLVKYIFLIPFYWVLSSISAFMAAYQLVIKPHYWEKTEHGLHLAKKKEPEYEAEVSISITPSFEAPEWFKGLGGKLANLMDALKRNFIDLMELLYDVEFKNTPKKGKLRILVLNWRDIKHVWAGGAETYVHNLAREWVKEGHSVTLFSGWDGKNGRDEVIDGVNIIRRGGFYTVYLLAPLYYLLRFRGKFDVIVDGENGIPFFSPIWANIPKLLLIHHVHQEVHRTHLPFPFSYLAMFLEGVLMPAVYKNTKVVTVSESSKADIEKLGLSRGKDIDIVSPGVEMEKTYLGQKTANPSFLYLGRIRHYKNIDIAVKAFSEVVKTLPNATLDIVGEGESLGKIKKLVRNLELSQSVRIWGWVSDEERTRFLSQSWVSLQPSSFEGWGITVLEANACATPVIASDVKGLRDSVVDGETGILVPPKDVDAFANAMIGLVRDPERLTSFSKAAYKWSRNFEWKNAAGAFMNAVKKARSTKSKQERGVFTRRFATTLRSLF